MSILVIFLTAIGLSMDAFAVALASGRSAEGSQVRHALRLGGAFGLAQMIMPLAGWVLGVKLREFIVAFDHWVAFGLLVFIGLKMFRDALASDDCLKDGAMMTRRRLFLLSIATSIDALAVGLTFAFLNGPVLMAALIIGVVTFVISGAGALIGSFCCCVWGRRAEMLGGVILIVIAVKILWDHHALGYLTG